MRKRNWEATNEIRGKQRQCGVEVKKKKNFYQKGRRDQPCQKLLTDQIR